MAEAGIAINHKIVRTTGLTVLYTIDGYFNQFKSNGVDYLYCISGDFKDGDVSKDVDGFYSLIDWLQYWENERDYKDIRKFPELEPVKKDDLITIERYEILESDNYSSIKKYKYSWSCESDGQLLDLIGNDKIDTQGASPQNLSLDFAATALAFFDSNKYIIQQSSEKEQMIGAFIRITKLIDNINKYIFPKFLPDYNDLISAQLSFWESSNVFQDIRLKVIKDFERGLFNFYYYAFINILKIEQASGDDKLYWLLSFINTSGVSVLTPENKIELLKIISKKLSSTFEVEEAEEICVKIVLSFNETNIIGADTFLQALIETLMDEADGTKVTLYQYLYDRMSSSWNITEGFIFLTNWVFSTDFKPTDTKGAYVLGLYALWQFSKYCPYNEDGSIKPDTLGFKILDSALAFFDNENDDPENQGCLFYYSHNVAYKEESHPTWDDLYIYKILWPNASPLILPYESDKTFGFFVDNFNFQISGKKIYAYEKKIIDRVEYIADAPYAMTTAYRDVIDNILYGTYDMYQPVSLLNTNLETKKAFSTVKGENVTISGQNVNSFVPLFVLEYIDYAGNRSNVESMIGFVVDVATTFTGIGNLAKLRHLRWAGLGALATGLFKMNNLRVVVAGIEFSSGVMGFLANFVECEQNDDFCNNMKTFISILQLSTLSVSTGDTIASLALKRSALRVTDSAGGGIDAETMRLNVKNRLRQMYPNESDDLLNETSNSIVLCSTLVLTPSQITFIIRRIKAIFLNRRNWNLHPSYTDTVLTNFIKLCKEELSLTDEVIEDLVYFANRVRKKANGELDYSKFRSPEQLELQAKYYVKEIKRRGFSAGFTNLSQYENFCNQVRNQFLQNLDDLPGDLSDHISSVEFVVKGSAARTWKLGDPEPPSGVIKPTIEADDIDMGFRLDPTDYDNFVEELKRVVDDVLDEKDSKILINNINKTNGKLQYDEIFNSIPLDNSNFSKEIIDACKQYTNFSPDKIRFAIIKQGGKYDNLPEVIFKY